MSQNDPINKVLQRLPGHKKHGKDQWVAKCPAHDDRSPSLSVSVKNGVVVLYCHAGCDFDSVISAIGLKPGDAFPEDSERKHKDKIDIIAEYDYTDEEGHLLFQVVRLIPKSFRQRQPDGLGGWTWNANGVRKVPFRLPKVLRAINAGETVWICEGERDALTIESLGQVATTSSGGAGKWLKEYNQYFVGAKVVIVGDRDIPGRKHALDISENLASVASSVLWVEPLPPHKDLTDHINGGSHLEELVPVDGEAVVEEVKTREQIGEELLLISKELRTVAGDHSLDPADALQAAMMRLESVKPPVSPLESLYTFGDLTKSDGSDQYDWVIPGLLERGDRTLLIASEGIGKALSVGTPIPTPNGWVSMGDLKVGDYVFDENREPVEVTYVSPLFTDHDCFSVTLDGCDPIVADAEHLWEVCMFSPRAFLDNELEWRVVKTDQLGQLMKQYKNVCVRRAPGVTTPKEDIVLPIDPYILGTWLASTKGSIHTSRADMKFLAENNIYDRPRIPELFLRGSKNQLKRLLSGMCLDAKLIERVGCYRYRVTFDSTSLRSDFYRLLDILGIWGSHYGDDRGVVGCLFEVTKDWEPFIPVKHNRLMVNSFRVFSSIVKTFTVPTKCIKVASETGLFLAGSSGVVTHNTMVQLQIASLAANGVHPFNYHQIAPVRTLVVDLENPPRNMRRNLQKFERCLRDALGDGYVDDNMHVWLNPAGMNLCSATDVRALETVIKQTRPELVCFGPLYKGYSEDNNKREQVANEVQKVFDYLRVKYGFALILEHHAPKEQSGSRSFVPYGSSYWQRWPEFGIKLERDAQSPLNIEGGRVRGISIGHWRGPRDDRCWPQKAEYGNFWPWHFMYGRGDDSWRKFVLPGGEPGGRGRYSVHRDSGSIEDF